jgi:hypothetical protein
MFMADASTEAAIAWNDGNTNYTTTGVTNTTDGDGNTATLILTDSNSVTSGAQPHDAAAYCDSLVAHGHTDWYLPAKDELHLIDNDGVTPIGDIGRGATDVYWSSTEGATNDKALCEQYFTNSQSNCLKNTSTAWKVRCVRTGAVVSRSYFVLTNSTWTGNLGGLSGANSKCLTELTNEAFKGKNSAILDSSHVSAFMCNTSGCNNLEPNTKYYYAAAGSVTAGGASFTTDSSGAGPGDSGDWSASTKFNTDTNYWNGHGAGTSTLWDTSPETTSSADYCGGDWSNTSDKGYFGRTGRNDDRRWMENNTNCSDSLPLVCFVNE